MPAKESAHLRRAAGLLLLTALTLGRAPESSAQQTESIATYLGRIEAFGFSGVAIVARGDSVIHASGHGPADREANRPYTTGSVVSLGSITKLYTAAAVLRLADRGALALSDTLGAYVPDLPADRSGITVEQLLTHTSGFGELPYADETDVSRRRLLEETRRLRLLDAPGASVGYSNLGFSLLGVVLEQVTGLSYEEALRREVLRPIRAWETGYTRAAWTPERIAAGYDRGRRWGTIVEKFPTAAGPSWTLMANGGLHSTVFDVLRFVRAFVGGEIVSPELVAASFAPHRGRFRSQGLGWHLGTAPDGSRTVGHDGSNNFLTAALHYLPAHDATVFLAANRSSFTAIAVMPAVLRLVTGVPTPLPVTVERAPLGHAERGAFVGTWDVAGGRLRVLDGGDHLQLQAEGQALLDRLLDVSPEVEARLTADTERARRIVTRARAGDFSGAPVLRRIWNALEESFGAVRDVEVLGSAPVWYGSARASWLRLHFAGTDRTTVRRLHWNEDGSLYGVGGSVYPAPVVLRCVGTGRETCTAMHPLLAIRALEMTVRGAEDADLRVGGASLTARRAAERP